MNVLVVGGSGGIGAAMVGRLLQDDKIDKIHSTCHSCEPATEVSARLCWHQLNVTDENQIKNLAESLDSLDWIINCVGLLHTEVEGPEKTVGQLSSEFFLENIRVNTLPTLLLAKHFSRHLKGRGNTVFATVSARVGSIEENQLGGWYSYRASKAALNMALKTLSLEWRFKLPNCSVAALHPGTTDTQLSKPFQANVPAEKLFSPEKTAGLLLQVIEGLTPEKSGRFWSWDGSELPW